MPYGLLAAEDDVLIVTPEEERIYTHHRQEIDSRPSPEGVTGGHLQRENPRFLRMCHLCRRMSPDIKLKCANCILRVFYCSKDCQIADWPKHKDQCKAAAQGNKYSAREISLLTKKK